MGLKNKEEGERRGHSEQQGEQQKGRKRREGGSDCWTGSQQIGRAKGAEVKEQNAHKHTLEIKKKRRLAGEKLEDLAFSPKTRSSTPPPLPETSLHF